MKRILLIGAAMFLVALAIIPGTFSSPSELEAVVYGIVLGDKVSLTGTEDDAWGDDLSNLDSGMAMEMRVEQARVEAMKIAEACSIITGFGYPACQESHISSGYGPRKHPVTKKPDYHHAVDIPLPIGTEISCPSEGVVVKVNRSGKGAAGKYIITRHLTREGKYIEMLFAHLSVVDVRVGEDLPIAGLIIGKSGNTGTSTGPHLHYAMRRVVKTKKGFERREWIDPTEFVKNIEAGSEKFLAKYGAGREQILAMLKQKEK